MQMDLTLPKKELEIAHLNVYILRNKIQDILEILIGNNLYVLAISETYLDQTTNSSLLMGIIFIGMVEIPVKVCNDLSIIAVKEIWLQIQLPYLRTVFLERCYRPPNAPIWIKLVKC